MKIIGALLLMFSTAAFSQQQIKIGEDSKAVYEVKKDSFAIYTEREKNKETIYLALTAQVTLKNEKNIAGYGHYKMLATDCLSETQFNIYRINDYDTEILSTHIVKFDENNIKSAVAGAICNFFDEASKDPSLIKNSIQNLQKYAQFAPDDEWSIPMKLGENKFLTLTDSIKFEDKYVSMIAKMQYPERTTDYYKIYIDREFCRDGKGHFEMRVLDTITTEMENIPFDVKIAPKDPMGLHFHKIAKTMCEYTISNYKFEKPKENTKRISDSKKQLENDEDMFSRALNKK